MTMPDPILASLLDQLATAVEHRDGATAVQVINHIRTAAGDDYTNQLVDHLIICGLTRLQATLTRGQS